jgi:acyl-CoA thioesterase-1
MTRRYGPGWTRRKAAIALACGVFISALAPRPAQAAPLRLLVLGDSLAAGYGLPASDAFQTRLLAGLRARGLDVEIVDGAVSGDTTAGGLARLDWVLAEPVDAALVELGGNDGLRGLDPRITEANLAAILDRLRAEGIPVLLSGMLAPPNLGQDYGDAFRDAFRRLGAREGVMFDPFFLEGVAGDPSLNQPDRIHPNARGVEIIAERMVPLVAELLGRVER